MTETTDSSNTSRLPEPRPSRAKHLSSGALIFGAVAILVVGLIVGLAVGYKIEKTRTQNDVKNLKKHNTTTTTIHGAGAPADNIARASVE